MDPKTGAGAYMISGGGNGSETGYANSDNLLILSSALLGLTDAGTFSPLPDKPWFSTSLIRNWYVSVASSVVGWLAASFLVFSNNDLSLSDKLGQVSMNMLGFAITTFLVSAIMSTLAIPFLFGVFISLFVAFTVALSVTLINLIYFSIHRDRKIASMAAISIVERDVGCDD